eukprot:SAG31_NODE_526_length_14475_cov_5.135197_11_plen_60_part_00
MACPRADEIELGASRRGRPKSFLGAVGVAVGILHYLCDIKGYARTALKKREKEEVQNSS